MGLWFPFFSFVVSIFLGISFQKIEDSNHGMGLSLRLHSASRKKLFVSRFEWKLLAPIKEKQNGSGEQARLKHVQCIGITMHMLFLPS